MHVLWKTRQTANTLAERRAPHASAITRALHPLPPRVYGFCTGWPWVGPATAPSGTRPPCNRQSCRASTTTCYWCGSVLDYSEAQERAFGKINATPEKTALPWFYVRLKLHKTIVYSLIFFFLLQPYTGWRLWPCNFPWSPRSMNHIYG